MNEDRFPKADFSSSDVYNKGVVWNVCVRCGQRTSVELGQRIVPVGEPWECSENTWNPAMAHCCSREEFVAKYGAFLSRRGANLTLQMVFQKSLDPWVLYNRVTQLGGLDSVCRGRWLPLVYRTLGPKFAGLTNVAWTLRTAYTDILL
eukprot:RCo022665